MPHACSGAAPTDRPAPIDAPTTRINNRARIVPLTWPIAFGLAVLVGVLLVAVPAASWVLAGYLLGMTS